MSIIGPLVGSALVSGASSIIGGILGNKSEEDAHSANIAEERYQYGRAKSDQAEQRTYDENREAALFARNEVADAKLRSNQFVDLRDAAQKGGFNPLSALGLGNAPAQNSPRVGSAALNVGPVIAKSGNKFGMITEGIRDFGEVLSGVTAQKQALYDHEVETAKRRLQQSNTSIAPQVGRNAPPAAAPNLVEDTTNHFPDEEVTNPYRSHNPEEDLVLVNPRIQNADLWAERYGEPGEIPGAIRVGWEDVKFRMFVRKLEQRQGLSIAREFVRRYGDPKYAKLNRSEIREQLIAERKRSKVKTQGFTDDAKRRRTTVGGF